MMSLKTKLKNLRAGLLDEGEIAHALAEFGRENLIEAKPDIERMLDHSDCIVRYNAVSTLAFEGFGTDRSDRIVEILLRDPDDDCRGIAAGALGTLFRGTRDELILSSLAKAALNETEEAHVRTWAYKAFLEVAALLPESERFRAPQVEDLERMDKELLKRYASR